MRERTVIVLIVLILTACPGAGFCRDLSSEEKVFAIQERIFHRNHEISLGLNYIPDNDFYESYPVGIAYTFHFNNYLAWEVARGQYFVNQEKELKGDLEDNFGVTPSEFQEPKYMIHSNLVIKPFYGKESIWNKGIVNHESYFLLGGGVVNYEKKFSYGDTETENAPSISLGYGIKYFVSKNMVMNLELRDLINFREEKTENSLSMGVGLSFRFNLSPRKTEDDRTAARLKEYLEEGKPNE